MPFDKMISNKDLLDACYRGDTAAIALFYDRYKDLVYSAIHKWMDKHAKDEDRKDHVKELFQQAFLELMDDGFAILKQARDQDKPSALIFLIAQQCAGRYFKKRWMNKKKQVEIGDPAQSEDDVELDRLSPEQITELIDDFIEELNGAERQLFELRFRAGLSYAKIAGQMGITVDNVGVMISRIRESFRAFARERYPSIENRL